MLKQHGVTVWLTGVSGAGKTTIGLALEQHLRIQGCRVEVLDGDVIRRNLSKELSFSKEDRDENIRRIGFIAHLLTRNDVIVVVCAISPYRVLREQMRQLIGNFVEVYVDAPLAVCEHRDVKGLYKKARSGEIQHFTGISDPFEPPLFPEVRCQTDQESIVESTTKILVKLTQLGYLAHIPHPELSHSFEPEILLNPKIMEADLRQNSSNIVRRSHN